MSAVNERGATPTPPVVAEFSMGGAAEKAELAALANAFGSDPEYARAGGGNASVKVDGVLHIKPSGVPMATLTADDLVPLRLDVLLDALHSDEPVDGDPVRVAAERAKVGNPPRRPSVEILFHALIPDTFVMHTHPPLVNMVTCNANAVELTARLFGDDAIFVPYTDPGIPLAREVERQRGLYEARTGRPAPGVTLLGNHGMIVSGATPEEVTERTEALMKTIVAALADSAVTVAPVRAPLADAALGVAVAPTLRGLVAHDGRLPVVVSDASEFVRTATLTPSGQAVLTRGPMIPDQIVYAGALPLVVEPGADAAKATAAGLAAYRETHGCDPVIVVVPGAAAFAVGRDRSAAEVALAMFTDALRVATGADALGEFRPMAPAELRFIQEWEAESYRKQATASVGAGRLDGKIVMVTGAAQGFGLGIATELLAEGGTLVLADLNIELATREAERLCAQFGPGRALAVAVNVSDEQSQFAAIGQVVAELGGVDVFISNAGVLRAGSVYDQPTSEFDLVTAVNYRGYFLGVRAVAPVMARQHAAAPGMWFDIVEINSKSGLEGSKRNFAYAGSKFGGIGLTQSFALELVSDGIKVNAICPGNYLDGPLWSDPERGLFVQYLEQGKVPGAQTAADVRAFYEAKVPMGRGCLPVDLARAVLYIVEQQYETGQALPVTGGQTMLN